MEQKTYNCVCGVVLETGKGHAKNDQCPEEFKVNYKCGFCGEIFDTFYAGPNWPGPTYKFLCNKLLCEECEKLAYDWLLKKYEL